MAKEFFGEIFDTTFVIEPNDCLFFHSCTFPNGVRFPVGDPKHSVGFYRCKVIQPSADVCYELGNGVHAVHSTFRWPPGKVPTLDDDRQQQEGGA